MSQQLERERTFLAKELPQEIKTTKPTRIVDIYIPDTPAHSHLRLRQNGKTYEITKKTSVAAGDASKHIEQTIPLTEEEFAALSHCSAKRVAKDRYRVVIDGTLAEIDIFVEDLAGLVLIDFEFDTEAKRTTLSHRALPLPTLHRRISSLEVCSSARHTTPLRQSLRGFVIRSSVKSNFSLFGTHYKNTHPAR